MALFGENKEKKILTIDKVIRERPELLPRELKLLVDEYEELTNVIESVRDRITIHKADFLESSSEDERESKLKVVIYGLRSAKTICLRERRLGENPLFAKFASLLSDLFDRLMLFERNMIMVPTKRGESVMTYVEADRDFEKLVVSKMNEALEELKQDIQAQKIKAEEARKAFARRS